MPGGYRDCWVLLTCRVVTEMVGCYERAVWLQRWLGVTNVPGGYRDGWVLLMCRVVTEMVGCY